MGFAIASYRIARDVVEGVQAELTRHGVRSSILAGTRERAELETRLNLTVLDADSLELDRLRTIVEGVLRRRGVPCDLASQGLDGGTRVRWLDPHGDAD